MKQIETVCYLSEFSRKLTRQNPEIGISCYNCCKHKRRTNYGYDFFTAIEKINRDSHENYR